MAPLRESATRLATSLARRAPPWRALESWQVEGLRQRFPQPPFSDVPRGFFGQRTPLGELLGPEVLAAERDYRVNSDFCMPLGTKCQSLQDANALSESGPTKMYLSRNWSVLRARPSVTRKNGDAALLQGGLGSFFLSKYAWQTVNCEGSERPHSVLSEAMEQPDSNGNWFLWDALDVPLSAVANSLDWLHAATGVPWWLTLVSSTLALRLVLLPLTILQVKKSAEMALLGPRLPPPVPLPGSGMTMRQAWAAYSRRRKELGVPSIAWLVAAPLVQVPLFVTWLAALRKMAVSGHPGFETGGILWFTDLTQPGFGVLGCVLPLLIGATHLAIVQVSFSGLRLPGGYMSWLIMGFKWTLQFLTLPTVWGAIVLPQGTHMYWLANNVFALAQAAALKSTYTRSLLGLPSLAALAASRLQPPTLPTELQGAEVDVSSLSAEQLVVLAAHRRVEKRVDAAINLLKRAVNVNKDYGASYVALGQLYGELQRWQDAAGYFNEATQKVADVESQLLAHLGMGIALANQGRKDEAMHALKEAIGIDPPPDSRSLQRHTQALISMASLLSQGGRKKEALQFLERAADREPRVREAMIRPLQAELDMEEKRASARDNDKLDT